MARKDSEKPKELIQSYLVTSAKYDFNVYEKRILYRIVELIQAELKGQPIGKGVTVESSIYGDKEITMPVAKFLKKGEIDKNHYRIKKAFERLRRTDIVHDTPDYYEAYPIVSYTKIEKNEHLVTFKIDKALLRDLLDFAKGYNQYELSVAFNFRSQYTMRFYELISRCSRPSINYSLSKLREVFMLENKYTATAMFIKKVIDPAQKELKESKSPYWFTYEKIKEGRAFKSILFRAHYRPEFDKKIPQQTSIRWDVDKRFLDLLNHSLGTDNKTWKPHRELLIKVQKADYNEIKKILRNAKTANNPIGYTVNSFKKINKQKN